MKGITVKIPQAERITIYPLADLHIGDRNCDINMIRARINTIREDPHAYAILDGDLIDNATTDSVGDTYTETQAPGEQITTISRLLEPISGKLLAAVPGNHERRTSRSAGIDITRIICERIGIGDKYSPETAALTINIGKIQYVIYISHGSGGGKKIGGKANALLDQSDIINADIYLQGHTHVPLVTRKTRFDTTRSGKIEQREMLFVNTAAALNYGGYGELAGFTPTSTVNPVIYLSGVKKFAWAVL